MVETSASVCLTSYRRAAVQGHFRITTYDSRLSFHQTAQRPNAAHQPRAKPVGCMGRLDLSLTMQGVHLRISKFTKEPVYVPHALILLEVF